MAAISTSSNDLCQACVLADVRRHGYLGEAEFYTSLQLIFLARKDLAAADQPYIRDWLVCRLHPRV